MDFSKIDRLKAKLDQHRPLSKEITKNLHENLVVEWTYNSNAIEGNTLTLQETKIVLEGITVGGKTLREHFEATNHKEAIFFIEELVQKNELLNEKDIKSIHALILKNIDKEDAGKYRDINVLISGAEHRPPQAIEVASKIQEFIHWYIEKHNSLHPIELASKIQEFIHWYIEKHNSLHPIELAARVHIDFVKIHPFADGNGRTSRLLMNLELIKHGYPPVIIKVADRLEYYKALDVAHTTKNYKPFMELTIKLVQESFENYFFVLGV